MDGQIDREGGRRREIRQRKRGQRETEKREREIHRRLGKFHEGLGKFHEGCEKKKKKKVTSRSTEINSCLKIQYRYRVKHKKIFRDEKHQTRKVENSVEKKDFLDTQACSATD